jgi:hypothetical protein
MNNTCTYIGPNNSECSCNKPALEGKSYCEEHYFVVYQKGSANRKRHKDIRVANSVWDIESMFNQAVEELEAEGVDF